MCERTDKKYCYPGTDILINKLGIKIGETLNQAERELTSLRIYELEVHPIKGNFDLKHLQDIHRYIFQDLYDWAGEIRTVDISKGNMFCNFQFISSYSEDIFYKLQKDKYLINTPKEKIIDKLAYYFSEINALHPFREGNGRTQREYTKLLACVAGYQLDFSGISQNEMIEASHKAFRCDYASMQNIFSRITSKISVREQQCYIEYIVPHNSLLKKEDINKQGHEL